MWGWHTSCGTLPRSRIFPDGKTLPPASVAGWANKMAAQQLHLPSGGYTRDGQFLNMAGWWMD
jgi:hypothetical protein